MKFFNLVVVLTSFSFLGYGVHCLISNSMKLEFKRYGLEKLRPLTGVLEILGGLGLLVGLEFKNLLQLSALGLALMMLVALLVRIKIKDPLLQALPALVLLFLNLYIIYN